MSVYTLKMEPIISLNIDYWSQSKVLHHSYCLANCYTFTHKHTVSTYPHTRHSHRLIFPNPYTPSTLITIIRHQKQTISLFIPYIMFPCLQHCPFSTESYQQLNFIIRLLDMRKSAPSRPANKTHPQKVVYKLTSPTLMKFRPERAPEDPSSATLIGRIKSLSKYFSRQDKSRADSLRKSTESALGGQGGKGTEGEKEGLQFLFRMDAETFLIDAIGVSTVDDYVESEQLWSLRGNSPFLQLLIDDRRKALVAVLQGHIEVYAYEGRRSKIPPKLLKSLRAVGQVRALQLARDSLLVFFEEAVHAYVLDGAASRQTSRKQYKVQRSLKLLQVGQCVDGVLPLIFSKPSSGGRVELYCLPVEIVGQRVGVGQLSKVYEVDGKQLQGLRVESVARDAFLMNLGQEILMFRKGYLVERVRITQKVQGTHLKYFGDRVLVHVSTRQLDFYQVAIDLSATPPKLALQSFDCVTLPPLPHYSFLDAVRLDPHRLAFFYHLPRSNSSGERKYAFAITLPWHFEDKVTSLLPRIADYSGKYEGPQFSRLLEEIAVGCDLVGKMGVSRKEAYLRVWRQSKKEQVQEFKLLLDTLDYATVREEILLKLRKKAMLFNEVHKVQAGCLGMLAQSLFGPRHTQDDLKNYLISHYLLRKLELFRDLRLHARKVGKIKTEQGEKKDKLFIDIQDYSTAVQMDIKPYILQLVYSLAKHHKDVATEIRLVLRKFRFPLRFVYEALLKDIVLTAKDDLLFLLKTIPQLLPLAPPSLPDPEEVALRSGVWGSASEEEWEAALHMQTVATIYNRQAVGQFGNTLWAKRYWLTQHDMLFHSRSAIQAERARTEGGHLFYSFLQVLFEQIGGQSARDVVSFLQETYVQLPPHLFNNVLLYRALFDYLKSSGGLEEGFAAWLRRSDQEIFKRLFQLQKARKGSLLREVKPIYQGLRQGDKFNLGLLRYFSSGVSEVSDIKYLLNRINNEKREFHDENIEMYQVLVKGMQIKLKLGSTQDIPISQVLIYINNIPLAHDHAVSHELALLQAINRHTHRFQHMRLDMSVFQIIRNRHAVLMATVAYQVQQAHMGPNGEQLKEKSARLLDDLTGLRASIYGPFQDNELLFILLAKLAERQELIPFLPQIAVHCAHADTPFQQTDLESLVFYCYRRQLTAYPVYFHTKTYLQALISLLPQQNTLRVFISSEVQLALLFSQGQQQVKFPLCGDIGLITTHHIEARMHALPTQSLQALNVKRVWELSSILQRMVGGSAITLPALHQLHFCALLRRGALHRALDSVSSIITLQPEDPSNIIYPLMVFRRIACEFTEENKALMVTLLGLLFCKPNQLLLVFQHLMGQSFSNEDKKMFLSQSMALHKLPPEQRFKMDNPLFNEDFLLYLQARPQSAQKVGQLLQLQVDHMLRCSEDWARSQDIPIYHLLVAHNPLLLLNYIHLSGSAISLKEARCFLSHLCKYPAYDPLKVLQFGKRIFKAMHDLHHKDGLQLPQLTDDLLSSPLVQGRSIEALDASTDNLGKLSKCVQKLKAKLKYKMASSSIMKRRSSINANEPSKQQQITDFLSDSHKYFEKCEYPFNDSDSYVENKEFLKEEHIVVAEAPSFLPKKYLPWVLGRKDQPIDYYLLKTNEEEADQAVRQQEEALKLSFRTAPHDKFFKPYANVVAKAYQRIVQLGKDLGALTESAIPAVPSSAISLKDIFPQVVQEVSLGASMLKDDILRSVRTEDDRLCFDSKLIQQFGTTQQIEAVLPDLLREIYHDPSLQYATSIALLREIHQSFHKLSPMSALWVQAYSKVDHMQRKLGLTLEPRVILPFEGLLVKEKDAGTVLGVVKQALQGQLNDNNIHTLSRVLALAFQKPQFQQHIINDYFGIILQEYSQLDNQLDQAMKLQKIMAFARKMPLGQLKLQVERTLSAIDSPSKQRRVVKAISDILRQRNDPKNADLLQSKWLQKPVSPRNGAE